MNSKLKRIFASAAALAVAASTMPILASAEGNDTVVPIFEGDTVLQEWKFDFGAADSTPEEGYTLVTPDTNFVQNTGGEYQYGFLGTNEEDYNLTDRYDGWKTQQGQVIELEAGGPSDNSAIGVVGAGGTDENEGKDIFGNQADIYYPTRFALKVDDDTYYRLKVTVTTLDPEQPATVSLYTERKHPIYTNKTLEAGTTYTETFSVRVTPIYYEKSSPTGAIPDEMVTVGVLGENSALASVEIQQVNSFPTLWVLGDSTVTDGNTTLPFFQLQQCTGVGTGLTKFLRRDWAVVNEGEGGLNATDNAHFNMVTSRIKEGDYMYVEYGHNHKADSNSPGPEGYKSCLDKYYQACQSAKAKLLIVSPVQSVNSWNSETQRWDDRFGGDDNFEGAGREFVQEKIDAGADDIAFVNLTETSVEFVDKVTEDNGNSREAAIYYYQVFMGGAYDQSHPNDLGAENFAYCFFTAAREITDETQKAVVAPVIENMTEEEPELVSEEIMAGGLGGSAWPQYVVQTAEKYPVIIDDVIFNDDGTIKQVDVTTRASQMQMNSYGVVIITIYNADGSEKGKLYAAEQVDNSTGYGPQHITRFRGDTILEDGDTYTAVVVEADADVQPVDGGATYSAVYKPTDIERQLLINSRNDEQYENFDYYGVTYDGTASLIGNNGWEQVGSSAITSYLHETSDGTKYTELTSDGAGSFYIAKPLSESITGTNGKYVISADLQYMSGSGMTFNLLTSWGSAVNRISVGQTLFTIDEKGQVTAGDKEVGTISATGFTNVQYILDTTLGTGTVTVGGSDPVTVDIPEYQTTDANAEFKTYTHFMFGGVSRSAFDVRAANLQVAKMKDSAVPEYTVSANTSDTSMGTATASLVSSNTTTGTKMAYSNGSLTVTSPTAAETTVVEAVYDENGVLQSLNTQPVTIGASGSETVPVASGSKLMLWSSLSEAAPLLPALETPEQSEDSNTMTLPINTIVTVTAQPNEGYVFTGWADGDGEIVSTNAEYSFRLRDNTTLTAQFAPQGGIEDIVEYSVVSDNGLVKVIEGVVSTLSIENVSDSTGNPIEASNADVSWSCGEPGVTVSDDGVVSLDSSFEIGEDTTKDVVISASLNDIERSYTLTVYSYDFYENVKDGKVTATWDGAVTTTAERSSIAFPIGGTTSTLTLPSPISLDEAKTISFIVAGGGNDNKLCGQPRYIEFYDSNGNKVINDVIGYSWAALSVGGTVGSVSIDNPTHTFEDAAELGSWSDTVSITIDKSAGTATVQFGSESAQAAINTDASDIASIRLISRSGAPDYTARCLAITDITIR